MIESGNTGQVARLRVRRSTAFLALPISVLSLVLLLALDIGPRTVAAPLLALVNIAVWFVVALWNRDSTLPVFEVGTVCVCATTVYFAYPLFAFMMSGGTWTALSDNRLQQLKPDMSALGMFAWRDVVYLASFALIYLRIRGRTAVSPPVSRLSSAEALVVLWGFVALTLYFSVIWTIFGVTYEPRYRDLRLGLVGVPRDLPYWLQQVSHNLHGILVILKLCGVALLLQRWKSPTCRVILVLWLAAEAVATTLRMGARSETVILILAATLLYHRLVRPLGLRALATIGVLLVSAVLLYGFGRDFGDASRSSDLSYWSAANEFQTLLGTAYDLHTLRMTGALDAVPWQVHASEVLQLVPSQLLPFPKIDPAEWYLGQVGLDVRQIGLMFGVIAQAVIGYDWIELIARGAVLGVLFASFHRMYIRRATSFWWSLLYLYVCLWSYYTVRASTFYFVYVLLYRFLPTMVLIQVGAKLVRQAGASRSAGAAVSTQVAS